MKLQRILSAALLMASLTRDAYTQTPTAIQPIGYLNVQGVLHENGQPVNGFMWFCWDIYAAPAGGTPLAHDTNMNLALVSNGVANVTYRIGDLATLSLSPTQELYLQIDVSPTGEPGSFTVLGPRQRIVPSLFASMAVRAEEARRLIGPVSESQIPSTLTRDNEVQQILLALDGSGSGVDADSLDGYDASEFWKLEGNAGTTAGVNFLGTTDNQPLELKVNHTRALRLEPNANAANVIAGSAANAITGTEGSSILGGHAHAISGALFSVIGGGAENRIDANAETAVVGGGRRNTIQADAKRSTIGGGATNVIQEFTDSATISGGVNNNIFPDTDWATIGGGRTNVIMNGAMDSTIGGGGYHYIGNGAEAVTISGGHSNRVTEEYGTIGGGNMNSIEADKGVICGGNGNRIEMNSQTATIGGGDQNRVNPSSVSATIGGGASNVVDQAAFATVGGGFSNVVGRGASVIGGGERNLVAASGATVAGGTVNQIEYEATGSVIGGGTGNLVQSVSTNAVIAGGLDNIVHTNANYASIGGGQENHIASGVDFATIPGGREAKAISYGQAVYASGGFAGREGTAQGSFYVLRGVTTDTNTTEIFLDGTSQRIHVPAASTWTYDAFIVARDAGGSSAGFQIRGLIGYGAGGNLGHLGAPIIDQFFGGGSIVAQVVPDNTSKSLTVRVRWGTANANTVRWVATVRTAEVGY